MPKENPTAKLAELQAAADRAAAAYDWDTAQDLYTEALELLVSTKTEGLPPETEYEIRSGRAACHEGRGTYAAALPDLEVMVRLAEGLDDAPRRIRALNRQAEALRNTGDPAQGQELAERALDLARQGTDQRLEVDSLLRLGRVIDNLGQVAQAQEHWELALDLARELDYPAGEAGAADFLGYLHGLHTGQVEESHRLLQTALALFRCLGDRVGE